MILASFTVIKLSLVALFGFFLYKKKVVSENNLKFLTVFVINFSVPFLIFSHLIANSDFVLSNSISSFLFISFSLFSLGCILGVAVYSLRPNEFKRESISMLSFQNSGYLPMNIAIFLFPQELRQSFLVYIFLYLLGFNIIMWSVGSYFIFRKQREAFKLKSLFTPPLISTVVALFFIYTHLAKFVPPIVIEPLRMVGNMSFVLSMIVLGSWLAKVKFSDFSKRLMLIGEISILKLIIIPLLCLIIIISAKEISLLGLFIFIQSIMPSAASLPIVANLRGADSEFVSQGVFFTHIISIFTIPLWLGLAKILGFPL